MSKINIGDKVKIHDGSYSRILKNGKLCETWRIGRTDDIYKVISSGYRIRSEGIQGNKQILNLMISGKRRIIKKGTKVFAII